MGWNWMVVRSVWITVSLNGHTRLLRVCTWGDQRTPGLTVIEETEVVGEGGAEGGEVAGETGEEAVHPPGIMMTTVDLHRGITMTAVLLQDLTMTVAVTDITVLQTVTEVLHPGIMMTVVPHPVVHLPAVPRHDTMMIVVMEAAVDTMMTVDMEEIGEVGPIDMAGIDTWTQTDMEVLVMDQEGPGHPVRTTEIRGPDVTIGAGVGHTKDQDTKSGVTGPAQQEFNWNIPYKFGIVPIYCK